MKRFHVHAHVENLQRSIDFYSGMFGVPPTRVESDHAKWMLEDPRLNFAISTRGTELGVDHLGIQTDTDDGLAASKARAQTAQLRSISVDCLPPPSAGRLTPLSIPVRAAPVKSCC